jgi:hypothetical protein
MLSAYCSSGTPGTGTGGAGMSNSPDASMGGGPLGPTGGDTSMSAAGSPDASVSEDTTPPTFDGLTKATALGETQVNVIWSPATDDITAPESIAYRLYLGDGSAPDMSAPFLTTPAGATGATVSGLKAAHDYQFTAHAVDQAGNEDANTVVVKASTPDRTQPVFGGISTVVSTSPYTLRVTWNPATDNTVTPVTYQVFVSTTQGAEDYAKPTLTTKAGATGTDITVPTDLTNYFVVVRAVDASGNSDTNKKELTVTTLDGTPPVFAGATSAKTLGTSITVKWDAALDNKDPTSTPYLYYNVYQSTSAGGEDFSKPTFSTVLGATAFTAIGLNVSTTYYFVVRSVDNSKNEDANKVEVSSLTAKSADITPPTFAGLANMANGLTDTSITLQWQPAVDDFTLGDDIVYDIFLSGTPGSEGSIPAYSTTGKDACQGNPCGFQLQNLAPQTIQYAIVRARDQAGNEDSNKIEKLATTLPDTFPPAFAGLVLATSTGPQSVSLSWAAATDDVSPASKIFYTVYQSTSAGTENFVSPVATTALGATQVVIGSLQPNVKYFFVVRATDEHGNRDSNTIEKFVTTDPDTLPPTFAGAIGAAAQSPTSILVSWNPASDDVSTAGQIQYDVYVATSSGGENFATPSFSSTAGATSCLVSTGFQPNTPYFFVVRARDAYGNSDSNKTEVTTSTKPDISAPAFAGASSLSGATNTTLTVNWAAALDNVTPPANIKYRVCYSVTAGACGTNFTIAATVTGGLFYTATGLAANTGYYFVVHADDAAGNRDINTTERAGSTTADTTAPIFVTGLTNATAQGPTSILLNWSAASDNVTPSSGIVYDVYQAAGTGLENLGGSPSYTSTAGSLSFLVTSLKPNTPYFFVVRARDGAGNRDTNAIERSATTLPDATAPSFGGVTGVTVVSETSLTANWIAASDDTNNASALVYRVCWSTSATACTTSFVVNGTSLPGALSFTAINLTPNTQYYFVVRSEDTYGNRDASTVVASATTKADVSAPLFGGATNVSGATVSTLTVNWNAASDNVTPPASIQYQVCMTTVSGNCAGTLFTASKTVTGALSSQFTLLTVSTNYYFVVRAVDAVGNSDGNSTQVSGSTVNDVTPPSFLGITSAVATNATTITLGWTAASDNVSSPAQLVYDIYQSSTPGGESFAAPTYTTAAGATSYSVGSLTPTTKYYFVARARDQAGNRDSNGTEGSATTQADISAPSFGGLTSVDTATASTLTLHWTAALDDSTAPANILYDICWSTSNGGCQNAGFSVLKTSAAGATSSIVTLLTPNTTYYFVVRARDAYTNRDTNSVQVSGMTITDTVPPTFGGITSLSNATVTSLQANWAAATDNATTTANIVYDVCWSTSSTTCQTSFSALATTPAGALNYTATGLTPSTTYFFVVRARDQANIRDANTNQLSAATSVDSTPPVFAGATSVSNPTITSLQVNWALATDVGTPQANLQYLICWSSSSTACSSGFSAMATVGSSTSYIASGLTPNTTYFFVVRARDSSPIPNVDSNVVVRSGVTSKDLIAPTGGIASSISNQTFTSFRVSFTQAIDNYSSAGNIEYGVCWSTDPASCTSSFVAPSPVTGSPLFKDITGLSMGTQYYVLVRAVDEFGNVSPNVTQISGSTLADTTPPTFNGTPTATQVIFPATSLSVSWAAASDNFWPAANIKYELCVAAVPNAQLCAGTNWTTAGSTLPGVTNFTLTNLTRRTQYYVMVRAVDGSNLTGSDGNSTIATTATSFANDINPTFFTGSGKCTGCHAWTYGTTVNQPSGYTAACGGGGALSIVLPGSPLNSYMYRKINTLGTTATPFTSCPDAYANGQMPNGGPFLDAPTIAIMYDWILQGANNN